MNNTYLKYQVVKLDCVFIRTFAFICLNTSASNKRRFEWSKYWAFQWKSHIWKLRKWWGQVIRDGKMILVHLKGILLQQGCVLTCFSKEECLHSASWHILPRGSQKIPRESKVHSFTIAWQQEALRIDKMLLDKVVAMAKRYVLIAGTKSNLSKFQNLLGSHKDISLHQHLAWDQPLIRAFSSVPTFQDAPSVY